MDEYLTDEQQADRVRHWLKENGPFMFGVLVLALGGLFGWYRYQDYRDNQAMEASVIYEDLLAAVGQSRNDDAIALVNELADSYSSTPYLDQAYLALAKLQMSRNAFDEAANYLAEVASGGASREMRYIAGLRLARVRLHQQQYDAALAALQDVDPNSAFAPGYHEVRGDVYVALGRHAEARKEYEAALATVRPGGVNRSYVQAKLDALPVADSVVSAETGPGQDATEAGPAEVVPPE